MESNGKSVRDDGQPTETHTAPIVWGGEETNGQHAFHQLLHQGTRVFSADLIASIRPGHDLDAHHDWLLANCLAQSEAMLLGREGDTASPHRRVRGGHPTTTILLDELDAHSLGALLALYEHKVFCLGTIWQVNPFRSVGSGVGQGTRRADPRRADPWWTGCQSRDRRTGRGNQTGSTHRFSLGWVCPIQVPGWMSLFSSRVDVPFLFQRSEAPGTAFGALRASAAKFDRL